MRRDTVILSCFYLLLLVRSSQNTVKAYLWIDVNSSSLPTFSIVMGLQCCQLTVGLWFTGTMQNPERHLPPTLHSKIQTSRIYCLLHCLTSQSIHLSVSLLHVMHSAGSRRQSECLWPTNSGLQKLAWWWTQAGERKEITTKNTNCKVSLNVQVTADQRTMLMTCRGWCSRGETFFTELCIMSTCVWTKKEEKKFCGKASVGKLSVTWGLRSVGHSQWYSCDFCLSTALPAYLVSLDWMGGNTSAEFLGAVINKETKENGGE